MTEITPPEVEAMISAGAIDPKASRAVLVYMAGRYLHEEIRKRERADARRDETTATARREQASAVVMNRTKAIAADIAARASTNWVGLLDRTFALPSGERVTWAAATIAQHDERAGMLENMAARDMETAALHREAITEIEGASVATLGEFAERVVAL